GFCLSDLRIPSIKLRQPLHFSQKTGEMGYPHRTWATRPVCDHWTSKKVMRGAPCSRSLRDVGILCGARGGPRLCFETWGFCLSDLRNSIDQVEATAPLLAKDARNGVSPPMGCETACRGCQPGSRYLRCGIESITGVCFSFPCYPQCARGHKIDPAHNLFEISGKQEADANLLS